MNGTSRPRREAARNMTREMSSAARLLRQATTSVLLAMGLLACSSSRLERETTPRSSPSLITAEEISKAAVQNAFEAVQKLRPAMLRRSTISSANAQSRGEVVVYVDNSRYGSVDNLRQIPASSIALVRYFTASESQLKWGSGHPSGVIEVVTKR